MYVPIGNRWFQGGRGFLFVRTYRLVGNLLVANTAWALVLAFLMANNVLPEFDYGENTEHAGMGAMYSVCGIFVLFAMFLPLFFGLSSRRGWPMGHVLGCASCWAFVLFMYMGSNLTGVLLLYIIPLPAATTIALAFSIFHGRQVGVR